MVETVIDPVTPQSAYTSKSALTPSQQIDSCHPYFLSSSDSPGMNLLNVTFDGSCYGNWCRGVHISLSAKNKL